jgi:hypothetical protein
VIELAVICALLVALNAWQQIDRRLERQEVRTERADLLQRISAPQHAAIAHYNANTPQFAPPAVNPDIDEDYYVSKEDLAEMAAKAETN